MKHTERFDFIISATIACIVIVLVLLCSDRLLNGPRQVKKQRDYIEHCLSYYINPYADGWGISIPLDEAEELINILEEQQNRIEELEDEAEELINTLEEQQNRIEESEYEIEELCFCIDSLMKEN